MSVAYLRRYFDSFDAVTPASVVVSNALNTYSAIRRRRVRMEPAEEPRGFLIRARGYVSYRD